MSAEVPSVADEGSRDERPSWQCLFRLGSLDVRVSGSPFSKADSKLSIERVLGSLEITRKSSNFLILHPDYFHSDGNTRGQSDLFSQTVLQPFRKETFVLWPTKSNKHRPCKKIRHARRNTPV